MSEEKEIKIKLTNLSLDRFIERIVAKGFRKEKKIAQLDIYFDTKDWLLYESLAALRLRIVNGKDHSFSFKKIFYTPHRNNHYFVEEIETHAPFNNLSKFSEIFNSIGVKYDGRPFASGREITDFLKNNNYFDEQKMPKIRSIFKRGSDEIVIDDVDKVGVIIELECKKHEPLEIVKEILLDSEWQRSLEGTSYIWLKNVKGLNSHIKNLERFKDNPKWNVWKTDNFSP